ncbi:MAG: hypothetical protein QOG65_162, partial [Actinomycetota bacterium]|nr:hypothetical protein [Actinomycetota bacterium]
RGASSRHSRSAESTLGSPAAAPSSRFRRPSVSLVRFRQEDADDALTARFAGQAPREPSERERRERGKTDVAQSVGIICARGRTLAIAESCTGSARRRPTVNRSARYGLVSRWETTHMRGALISQYARVSRMSATRRTPRFAYCSPSSSMRPVQTRECEAGEAACRSSRRSATL